MSTEQNPTTPADTATATTPTPTAVDKPTTFPKKNKGVRMYPCCKEHRVSHNEYEKGICAGCYNEHKDETKKECSRTDDFTGPDGTEYKGELFCEDCVGDYANTLCCGAYLEADLASMIGTLSRRMFVCPWHIIAEKEEAAITKAAAKAAAKADKRVSFGPKRTRPEEEEHKPKQSCVKKLKPTATPPSMPQPAPTATPKVEDGVEDEWFKALFKVFLDFGGPYGYLSNTEVCEEFSNEVSDEALQHYKDNGLLKVNDQQTLVWGWMDAMTHMMNNCLTEQELRAFCFGEHEDSDLARYMRDPRGWNEPTPTPATPTPKVENEHKEFDERQDAYNKELPQDGSSVSLSEASRVNKEVAVRLRKPDESDDNMPLMSQSY